ncbi:GIY-YIG nuclease family protein [Pedobacter xixiisoli]|uniref:GIY-YIG nuclease family protein n=1 Tax=Pedobacter xixiisoli TaxID=1476464 RepID=UPI003B82E073
MELGGCVYILSNYNHRVLYVGVTSDLLFRIKEHKEKCTLILLLPNITATS